jgi:hypothetical protein
MGTKTLNENVRKYLKNRKEMLEMIDKLHELKADNESLQDTVIEHFNKAGISKGIFYGRAISLVHNKDIKVFDEEALLKEFVKRKDMDYIGEFTKKKVDVVKFKKFAKALLASNQELLPGTERTETDTLKVTDFVGDIISLD